MSIWDYYVARCQMRFKGYNPYNNADQLSLWMDQHNVWFHS